jgi:long-chain acyl-CoA synthetase
VEKKIKNDSVGIPVSGVEVRIDNADELGNGEIYIRGPNVMQGYYNNKKVSRDSIDENGWMATGDIGKLDSEGYLYITGRKKSIIVTPGGKNVYPEEIEEMLNSSPFVLESLVLGIPVSENDKSENIYALIVPDYEYLDSYAGMNSVRITDELVESLIARHVKEVSGRLADYKKIKGWRIRSEEFPKTSTRKIKRFLFSGRDFLNS